MSGVPLCLPSLDLTDGRHSVVENISSTGLETQAFLAYGLCDSPE